jgi:hypothetical protein
MSSTKQCIYCGETKDSAKFSLEHIWPKALGGTLLGDDWKSRRVCERCNNICGLYVDGEFLKTFFGKMERYVSSVATLTETGSEPFELSYLGPIGEVEHPAGFTLEYWAAPGFVKIFVSAPNEQFREFAGGDPRKKSNVCVYFFLTPEDIELIKKTYAKICQVFEEARVFAIDPTDGNVVKIGEEDTAGWQRVDADCKVINQAYNQLVKTNRFRTQMSINPLFANRFLAKLALGIGHKILGEDYIRTSYASELRKSVFEADANKRQLLKIRGTGYFGSMNDTSLEKIFHSPSAWTLVLKIVEKMLCLIVITPAKRALTILISENFPIDHESYGRLFEGLVWRVFPDIGKMDGPTTLSNAISQFCLAQDDGNKVT